MQIEHKYLHATVANFMIEVGNERAAIKKRKELAEELNLSADEVQILRHELIRMSGEISAYQKIQNINLANQVSERV